VIIALVNMGLPLEGIETHARRAGRSVLPALVPSTQPKQLSILQAGLKQSHPQHIPVHLPQFPDPHAYIRTPVSIIEFLVIKMNSLGLALLCFFVYYKDITDTAELAFSD
jgi:hypothetical protein